MKSAYAYGLLIALALASPGRAENICSPLSETKAIVKTHGGRWTVLSPDQWQFLRGMYVATPPLSGLPYGDSAAIILPAGSDEEGLVIFVDGDAACEKMPLPGPVVEMVLNLWTIRHEGQNQ